MIRGDEQNLLCHEVYLHQKEARVTFRDMEDGPASHTKTNDNGTEVIRLKGSDAPGRRDAIEIDFTCEICDG